MVVSGLHARGATGLAARGRSGEHQRPDRDNRSANACPYGQRPGSAARTSRGHGVYNSGGLSSGELLPRERVRAGEQSTGLQRRDVHEGVPQRHDGLRWELRL